jgi:hypothetical protein
MDSRDLSSQGQGAEPIGNGAETPAVLPADEPTNFHSLAFELLGIDYLPLPRMDGFDGDPYLTDGHYQELCNIVCELVPGMAAKDWWEASEGQRIACLETALRKSGARPEVGRRVVLRGPGERPIVGGVEKGPLTLPQYDVVKALLDAGERGLSKDELDRKSKHGDARKILKRLAKSDPDWNAAIHFPGKAGGGYRIG